MKRSSKFLIISLVVTIVFSAVSIAAVSVFLNRVRESTNNTVLSMIACIQERYPDVYDNEIAEILNSKNDTAEIGKALEKYGIDVHKDWVVYDDNFAGRAVIATSGIVCFIACVTLSAIFVVYNRVRRKEIQRIADCIYQINRGNYDLHIEENSEDETSLLKNEIYKTTVMLREQSENSLRDKQNLKDSLSDISHQLKTPLTSIIVMLDNIIDNEDMPDDLRREFLNDIRRSSNNISFLVQSILTLSKLDANSILLKSKSESIEDIFNECIRNTAILAEINSVNLAVDLSKDIRLDCDFKWLSEAITNIVKNCIEHTPEKGVVTLKAEQNKLYTKITISDNGVGISKEDLPHIFERFYKGRNSHSDSVGIGLALAKAIIEKGGGLISVASELNKGTTFTIKYFINRT